MAMAMASPDSRSMTEKGALSGARSPRVIPTIDGRSDSPSRIPHEELSGVRRISGLRPAEVPAEEAVFLDPIEKFKRYRVLPWKMLLHTLIFVLLLVITYVYQNAHSAYNINARFGLANAFFDMSDNTDKSLVSTFKSVDGAVQFIQAVARQYEVIPDESPGVYMHYVQGLDNLEPIPALLRVTLIANPFDKRSDPLPSDVPLVEMWSNLTHANNHLGEFFFDPEEFIGQPVSCRVTNGFIPCRNASLPELFDRIVSADVTMVLRSVRFYEAGSRASMAKWNIKFSMTFDAHGSEISIAATFRVAATDEPNIVPVVVLSLLVPLVLFHFLLRLRAFQRYHIHMKTLLPQWAQLETWESRAQQERHAGNSWKIFAMVVDVFCLLFVVLAFTDLYMPLSNETVQVWKKVMLGFSAAGYNILFLSYLQTSPRFYVLIKTMSLAIPQLIMYCVGVFPVFAAFALSGNVIAGTVAQDTFGTVQLSACTLFCILNGDSLLQLFTEINQSDFWILRQTTRIFMMAFLAYFYANALNVMMGIVQDCFTQVRDLFEVCQYDLEKCEDEFRRRGPSGKRRKAKKMRTSKRFDESSSDSETSMDSSASSSHFEALGRGEVTSEGLRALATQLVKLNHSSSASASNP
jgi:hypothetical protein